MVNGTPAVAACDGCAWTISVAAVPALTGIPVAVAWVRLPLVMSSEIDPLISSTRSLNVATPLMADMVSVPLNVPLDPLPSATVTGPEYDVSTFPYGSSASTTSVKATPAMTPLGGFVTTTTDFAAAGVTIEGAE